MAEIHQVLWSLAEHATVIVCMCVYSCVYVCPGKTEKKLLT